MGAKKNYNDILKNRNLKVTKHRYAILESLEKSKLPVSAESLYIELKKKGISISLSTVYRSLEALYKKGIVIKSILPDYNKAVFEYNHEHRHHMICIKCHKNAAGYRMSS